MRLHIVIQKFGGTSVEDARAMARVIRIVRAQGMGAKRRPLVVLSACAGVTNDLIRASETAILQEAQESLLILDRLEARHARIARELIESQETLAIVLRALH